MTCLNRNDKLKEMERTWFTKNLSLNFNKSSFIYSKTIIITHKL